VSVVEMTSRLFPLFATFPRRTGTLNVVAFHQLTVVAFPFKPFPISFLLFPVLGGLSSVGGQVRGLVARRVLEDGGRTGSFFRLDRRRALAVAEDGLLSRKLLCGRLRFHLLSQQRDVLDTLQLAWISEKLVTVAFALNLSKDVDSVVISQRPTHLVIVHGKMIFLNAPESCEPGGIDDLENASLLVLPLDVGGVPLAGVVQQLLKEIPKESAVGGWGIAATTARAITGVVQVGGAGSAGRGGGGPRSRGDRRGGRRGRGRRRSLRILH